ncbi:MAG: hypothetical protein ACK5LM_01870 [Lactovum sp.]
MKKIIIFIFTLVLLTACGKKSDHEKLVAELDFPETIQTLELTMGGSQEEKEKSTGNKIVLSFDKSKQIIFVKTVISDSEELEIYFTPTSSYIKVNDEWYKSPDETSYSSYLETFEDFKIEEILDPKAKISDTLFTDSLLYNVVKGKSYEELVVKKGKDTYSLKGLEEKITLSTLDGLSIETKSVQGSSTVTIKSVPSLILPKIKE